MLALNDDPKVRGLYTSASHGRPRGTKDIITADQTHITATVLEPGDVAFWPQGGPGSQAPAWHAFRQIGEEPRTSVSYHFVQQPNLAPGA